MEQLREVVTVVAIDLWCVVQVVEVVEVAVLELCGCGVVVVVVVVLREVVVVVDVGYCQEELQVVLDNVPVLDVAACSEVEVEVVWEMGSLEEWDDVVELVAMLGMVVVEHVRGMGTNVAVWAVVVAVDVVVMNRARDTSWLLGKANNHQVNVCM